MPEDFRPVTPQDPAVPIKVTSVELTPPTNLAAPIKLSTMDNLTVDNVVRSTLVLLRDKGAEAANDYRRAQENAYDSSHKDTDKQGTMRNAFSKAIHDGLTKDGVIPALDLKPSSQLQTSDPKQRLVNEVEGKITHEGSSKAWDYYGSQIKQFYSSHLDAGTDPDGSKTKELSRATYDQLIKDGMLPALQLVSAIPSARHDASSGAHPTEHPAGHPEHTVAHSAPEHTSTAAPKTESWTQLREKQSKKDLDTTKDYKVERGDTLSDIASRALRHDNSKFGELSRKDQAKAIADEEKRIIDANKDKYPAIAQGAHPPRALAPGWTLTIAKTETEATPKPDAGNGTTKPAEGKATEQPPKTVADAVKAATEAADAAQRAATGTALAAGGLSKYESDANTAKAQCTGAASAGNLEGAKGYAAKAKEAADAAAVKVKEVERVAQEAENQRLKEAKAADAAGKLVQTDAQRTQATQALKQAQDTAEKAATDAKATLTDAQKTAARVTQIATDAATIVTTLEQKLKSTLPGAAQSPNQPATETWTEWFHRKVGI